MRNKQNDIDGQYERQNSMLLNCEQKFFYIYWLRHRYNLPQIGSHVTIFHYFIVVKLFSHIHDKITVFIEHRICKSDLM